MDGSPCLPTGHVEQPALPFVNASQPHGQMEQKERPDLLPKCMTSQSKHSVLFSNSWYIPGLHGRQAADFLNGVYEPGKQEMQSIAFVLGWNCPIGHPVF